MPRVVIPKRLLEEVMEKSVGHGVERVFIGIGLERGGDVVVEELYECSNISETPDVRFVADPLCVYNVYRTAEDRGLSVVLLVHSHPAPPVPSVEDLKGMEASGSLPWLIISSRTGEFKAWVLVSGRPAELDVYAVS